MPDREEVRVISAEGVDMRAVHIWSFVPQILVFGILAVVSAAQSASAPPPDTGATLGEQMKRREYDFSGVPGEVGVWSAPNRAQGLRSRVSARGLELWPRATDASGAGAPWRLGLRTVGLRRGTREIALGRPSASVSGSRASLDHGALVEWFENDPLGIEQGWTIERRPEGDGALIIALALSAGFEAVIDANGHSASLRHANVTLPYRDLQAWDAGGRTLPARLVAERSGCAIEVDDAEALYPLTVDPVLAWIAEGDDMGSEFGFSVASAGDVNGDGYDDVIIGAKSYDDGEANEGRAFVYHGSATGLTTTPAWSAESNQPDALYGHAVASAGDVNGDGYDDVIVGAIWFNNGHDNEGRAFVYHGSPTGLSLTENWTAELDQDHANLGTSVACAGRVNNDAFDDVIVGASFYDNGFTNEGGAFVYYGSGTGLSTESWRAEGERAGAALGHSVASAGDVNGDTYSDVIVGCSTFGNNEAAEGAALVFLGSASGLGANGTPDNAAWKVESNQAGSEFGYSVSSAGDVNGDGFSDVIVGARLFDKGQSDEGCAFAYHGSASGLSTSEAWIGEFDQASAEFGLCVSGAGDVDSDGYSDVIVGARYYENPVTQNEEGRAFLYRGSEVGLASRAAWTAEGNQTSAYFGFSVSGGGDVDGDGYDDFVVGAYSYNTPSLLDAGRVYLYSTPYGEVLYQRKIADGTTGGLPASTLAASDGFGTALALIGDLDNDGNHDLAAGAPGDGAADRGAVYLLEIDVGGSVLGTPLKIDGTGAGFTEAPDAGDGFGAALAAIGDLDGDGIEDLAVGASTDEGGGTERGALWILFLDSDGTVSSSQKISAGQGGFTGTLADNDEFGSSIADLGDLDGAGGSARAIAVGELRDDDGGTDRGAVWILFLDASGMVTDEQKVSSSSGSFTGPLSDGDQFGSALASLGDLDGSGGDATTIAVGARADDSGGADAGALWVLSLSSAGLVGSETKIGEGLGGFPSLPGLDADEFFGQSLANLGDIGGPGVVDLALGIQDDSLDPDAGAVWILSLDASGAVVGQHKSASPETGAAADGDRFGRGLAALGDLDGDGRTDLAAGASLDDQGASGAGAVWIQFLNDGTLSLLGATSWTGATNDQWALGANWTGGVPDEFKTAIIPDAATTPNDPLVSSTTDACNTLWLQPAGTLQVASAADLDVFGGASVTGPITGLGELVFAAPGTLTGNSTISVPDVTANENLTVQGGPLDLTGTLTANADLQVASLSSLDVGGDVLVGGSLEIDGNLDVGDSVTVTEELSSSSGGTLTAGGAGECITAGQVCVHGPVFTACSLAVEGPATASNFELDIAWPSNVSVDAPGGPVTLLTQQLSIAGSLVIEEGTFAVGVDGTMDVGSIVVQSGATLDIGGFQTLVPAPATITVQAGGKLNIGAGGELLLETNTLTIESGGTLCLDGTLADRAALGGFAGNRYTLDLQSGSTLAAKGFAFRGMAASGIVIGPGVDFAPAPLDFHHGLFDDVATGGVLLDIEHSISRRFHDLVFENTGGAVGAFNLRTHVASAPLVLIDWSGAFAGEPFEDDPGVGEPGLIEWGEAPGEVIAMPAPSFPELDPPPMSLTVGPSGSHADVGAALRDLRRRGQRRPTTLILSPDVHEPFNLDATLGFDLCLVGEAGAVIDASSAPLSIDSLAAGRSLELVNLSVDAGAAPHPAVVVSRTTAVVLLQGVTLLGHGPGPRLCLSQSGCVALQGGRIEGALRLEQCSRATASAAALTSIELAGNSTLETRGATAPVLIAPGSLRLDHGPAPQLSVTSAHATLTGSSGLAWLGFASRLGFQPLADLEGVPLLSRWRLATPGARHLASGPATWLLGPRRPGQTLYLQALTLDPSTGRMCLSDVVRLDPAR